jgi:hypothetical protein
MYSPRPAPLLSQPNKCTSKLHLFYKMALAELDDVISQAYRQQLLTAERQVQSHVTSYDIHSKVKLSLQQAMGAYKVVRC